MSHRIDHSHELRPHRTSATLSDLKHLSPQRHLAISELLAESGWLLYLHKGFPLPSRGQADGFLIGAGGVFALMFAHPEITDFAVARIRHHAGRTFAGIESATMQPIIPLPVLVVGSGPRPAVRGCHLTVVEESAVARTLCTDRSHTLSPSDVAGIAVTLDAGIQSYRRVVL